MEKVAWPGAQPSLMREGGGCSNSASASDRASSIKR